LPSSKQTKHTYYIEDVNQTMVGLTEVTISSTNFG